MNKRYTCAWKYGVVSAQYSHSVVSDSASSWAFSMPGFLVHHQSLELAQSHVHCVGEATQPPHPLLSPSPTAFNLYQHQGFFSNESALCIRWPKYWHFRLSMSPSNEYSELISFRIDWLDLLQSKGLSRVFSNTTIQNHLFGSQVCLWSNSHSHT